jgi:hypothetical protein
MESIGFVTGKRNFSADFHVLGLFKAKKHVLSEKKFASAMRRYHCKPKFVPHLQPPLKS